MTVKKLLISSCNLVALVLMKIFVLVKPFISRSMISKFTVQILFGALSLSFESSLKMPTLCAV